MDSDEEDTSFPKHGKLVVRVGECTENRAYVFADAPARLHWKTLHIEGWIRGPYCRDRTTLPTTYPFRLVKSEPRDHLVALITDPCPWAPDEPMLYRAEVKAEFAMGNIQTTSLRDGTLAIRRFAPRGTSLFLNGKRWVIRGIHDYGPIASVSEWKQHASVRVVRRLQYDVLRDAENLGLMLVARLRSSMSDPPGHLRGITSSAVAMIVVPHGMALPDNIREVAPNLVLAQEIVAAEALRPWAHVAWIKVAHLGEFRSVVARIPVPIVAERRYRGDSLSEARAAIDTLQADLAPIGQFAGYVV